MLNFFKTRQQSKTAVVALHGFGRRRTDEFLPLKNCLASTPVQLVLPELFNPRDPQDIDPQRWIERAEEAVQRLLQQDREVILIGFSMGGVIASHIAACMPVSKLILLAPAFSYVNMANAADFLSGLLGGGKKEENDPYPNLPADFTSVFMNVVDSLKQDITLVDCPVLIFHGTADETIALSSSRRIFNKIPTTQKALVMLEGVGHRILDDPVVSPLVLNQIRALVTKELPF